MRHDASSPHPRFGSEKRIQEIKEAERALIQKVMSNCKFKNEEAGVMIDYYKCYLMPLLFFPALSLFVLKPIFIKK